MKYNGQGFLHGVPARDLTEAEAKHYGIERLLASGLYSRLTVERKTKTKKIAVESAGE
jgi:hypothetical protein